jgi:tRNA (pseudouridine54-N1)-methyltransferase
LFSRLGRTDSNFFNLHDAGRLDIVYECIVASLFLSHAIRKDVVFHAVLNGPPKPPVHVEIDGSMLHDVRTDQQTWTRIFKNVLSGKNHPGITVDVKGFEPLLKAKAKNNAIYILEEHGTDVAGTCLKSDSIFILGDHVGLPKTAEKFALRYGEKISLGKRPYLAATCVSIINYYLDKPQREQ